MKNNPSKESTVLIDEYKAYCDQLIPLKYKPSYRFSFTPLIKQSYIQEDEFQKIRENFFNDQKLLQPPKISTITDMIGNNFIVGENHSHKIPKDFLIQNMEDLKKQGYEILFMEHLFYDDQALLDQFHSTGEMNEELKSILDKGFGYGSEAGFLLVVQAAQKAGIRVVGIDIEASYNAQYDSKHCETFGHYFVKSRDNFRISSMNYTAYHIIIHESQQGKLKWFGLMGSGHLKNYQKVPGVAELMGATSILIMDDEKVESNLKLNYSGDFRDKFEQTFDVFISANPQQKPLLKIDDLKFLECYLSYYKRVLSDCDNKNFWEEVTGNEEKPGGKWRAFLAYGERFKKNIFDAYSSKRVFSNFNPVSINNLLSDTNFHHPNEIMQAMEKTVSFTKIEKQASSVLFGDNKTTDSKEKSPISNYDSFFSSIFCIFQSCLPPSMKKTPEKKVESNEKTRLIK